MLVAKLKKDDGTFTEAKIKVEPGVLYGNKDGAFIVEPPPQPTAKGFRGRELSE